MEIFIASEGQTRQMTEKIIGDVDVACELVQTINEQDGECSVRPAPLCWVTNLLAVVVHQPERSYDMLTRHENSGVSLPKDEIWLKFGGDKCGGSFKSCNQIVNRHRPISADHTMVILCTKRCVIQSRRRGLKWIRWSWFV